MDLESKEEKKRDCVFQGMIECERLLYEKCTMPEDQQCLKKDSEGEKVQVSFGGIIFKPA